MAEMERAPKQERRDFGANRAGIKKADLRVGFSNNQLIILLELRQLA